MVQKLFISEADLGMFMLAGFPKNGRIPDLPEPGPKSGTVPQS